MIHIPNELTREYLLEFYNLVLQHPDIMEHITEEIHITARAKAGGKLKGKNLTEGEDDGKEEEAMPEMMTNSANMGGKVIEATDTQTIIPVVLMKERVTNGALKQYEEFAPHAHWFEGVPIIGPHHPGDPPVNHLSAKAGKLRNVRLNSELRRVEAEAILFNDRIAPGDLERIKNGEPFGGSIGYYCNEEKLDSPQLWTDGTEYKSIERGPFFADHFSMVPSGACPLPECGFNINAEVIEMTEEVPKVETPKANTEVKPEEAAPVINVAAPTVNVDMSTVLTKLDTLVSDMAAIKINIASKDEEIKTLKAAEEVRTNAQKAAEDALILNTLDSLLLPAFKEKKAEFLPAFKANAALFIAQNPEKIDLAAFSTAKITATGQPFVPHVNATDEDPYEAAGAQMAESLIKKVA